MNATAISEPYVQQYSISEHAIKRLTERSSAEIGLKSAPELREWLDRAICYSVDKRCEEYDDGEQIITAVWLREVTQLPLVAVIARNTNRKQPQDYVVLTIVSERMAKNSTLNGKWREITGTQALKHLLPSANPEVDALEHEAEVARLSLVEAVEALVEDTHPTPVPTPPPAPTPTPAPPPTFEAPSFTYLVTYFDEAGQLIVETVAPADDVQRILLKHVAAGRKVQLYRPQHFTPRTIIVFGD